jgi:AraC-like DNA-binding protein
MAATQAGDVVLTKLEANRHRVLRSPRLARASDTSYLKIVAPWQGSAAVEQQGRQAWVKPGGWAIYDTTGSYEIANPERVEHLIVMLPKENIWPSAACAGAPDGAPRGRRTAAFPCGAGDHAQHLPGTARHERGPPRGRRGNDHRTGAPVPAGTGRRESATTQLEAFRDRIRDHIGQHLRDPGSRIDRIAQALNCSKRHLHNAFSAEDDTLASYILRRRLQACMRDLKNPALLARTITDIAFSWGFNSGAHFSRVFREHAGLSPSDFRAGRASADLPESALRARVLRPAGPSGQRHHGSAGQSGRPSGPLTMPSTQCASRSQRPAARSSGAAAAP